MLSFQPLTDGELAVCLDFSRIGAGQDLNNALSVAFEELFSDISRAKGLASARFMTGREL